MIITDQAAYSDQVFGLYWLLGYQFSPRPAGLPDQRFWYFTRDDGYGALHGLARNRINTPLILAHWDCRHARLAHRRVPRRPGHPRRAEAAPIGQGAHEGRAGEGQGGCVDEPGAAALGANCTYATASEGLQSPHGEGFPAGESGARKRDTQSDRLGCAATGRVAGLLLIGAERAYAGSRSAHRVSGPRPGGEGAPMSPPEPASFYNRCRAEVTALLDARTPVRAVERRIDAFAVDANTKAALWLWAHLRGCRIAGRRAGGEVGAPASGSERIGQTATAQICRLRG